MSGKRSYTQYAGRPSANYKAARMVGGKLLRYNPSRPVAGSFRSRQVPAGGMLAAVRRAAEKKGMDTSLSSASVVATTNTNDNCIVLNLIQQGAGSWNRIGRKVTLNSVRLRGTARLLSAPTAVTGNLLDNTLRMVVVWDKQPSGAAIPTFDTVFGLTDQSGTESTTYLSPVKYDNMDRFSVLRDTIIDCGIKLFNGAGLTENTTRYDYLFDEYIPLNGKETTFLGQSVPMTIADISSGALYVYFRAEFNAAGTSAISIDGDAFARLRYTDL